MKHQFRFIVILALLTTLTLSGCGIIMNRLTALAPTSPAIPETSIPASPSPVPSPTPEPEPEPDYLLVYREQLNYLHNILSNGIEDWEYGRGEVGIMEIANASPGKEALASVGYAFEDLSGDDIPELLVMNIDDPESKPATGGHFLALFSVGNDTPTLTFEGWSRSHYIISDQDIIFHFGSNGALDHVYIINKLSLDGKTLECINYYATRPKDENQYVKGFFRDPECGEGQHIYEELDLNDDSFGQLIQDQVGEIREFELTPFSDYIPSQGTLEPAEPAEPAVTIQWAEDTLANYSSYDTLIADESEPQVKILLSSTYPLKNFNFLKLSIDGADEQGRLITTTESIYNIATLMPNHPLVVAMTFYGDLPSYGISYKDEKGETRNLYITQSGKDGSLMLVEINTP